MTNKIEFNPILQAKAKPNSLKTAIKAMCSHCVGCTEDHIEPGYREAIRECKATSCPIYFHRPFTR